MRQLLLMAVLLALLYATPAHATPASELAAQAGVTEEKAAQDLVAQGAIKNAPTGTWFDNRKAQLVVPVGPGQAQPTVEGPARFPKVKRTYAQLQAARDAILRDVPQVKVAAIYPQGNTVKAYYQTYGTTSATREAVKSEVAADGGTAIADNNRPPQATSCVYVRVDDGGYCNDQAFGGVSYWGEIEGVEGSWRRQEGCSLGFVVKEGTTTRLLTAGHCLETGINPWQVRDNWECYVYPYGSCKPIAPWPPNDSECLLHTLRYEHDNGGDWGLLSLGPGCVDPEPYVATWFGEQEKVTSGEWFSQFNCTSVAPDCNHHPASKRAIPGEWQCHYGMQAEVEVPGYRESFPSSNCGIVKYTDIGVTFQGGTHIEHLDVTCSYSIPGDSGSPMIEPRGLHSIATGIVTGAGYNKAFCGEELETTWTEPIDVVMAALGVHF